MLLLVGVALFFALIAWTALGVAEARAGVKRLNAELGFALEPDFEKQDGVLQEGSTAVQASGPNVRTSSIAA